MYTTKDKYHQEAFATIADPSSKMRTYGLIKDERGRETYLRQITNPLIRKSYTKFRLSNHILNIEKRRHNNIPKEVRFCPFCLNQVETEIHFLIEWYTKHLEGTYYSLLYPGIPRFYFIHRLGNSNTCYLTNFRQSLLNIYTTVWNYGKFSLPNIKDTTSQSLPIATNCL